MSLDARFTQLRRPVDRSRPASATTYQRNPAPRERISSLKNRLLALEMAERPHIMAALSSRGRQRAPRGGYGGPSAAILASMGRSRSPFPRARARSRQRSSSMRRSNSMGRLQRSQSVQSLMSIGSENGFNMGGLGRRGSRGGRGGFRTRIFTRGSRISGRGGIQKLNMDLVGASRRRRSASLSRIGNSVGGGFRKGRGSRGVSANDVKSRLGVKSSLTRSASLTNLNARMGSRGGRGGLKQRGNSFRRGTGGRGGRGLGARSPSRGRGGPRGGSRGASRGAARGGAFKSNKPGGRGGGFRGRSGQRGGRGGPRGRGGRGGGPKKPVVPTKEELDMQLDQYMSNTRSYLDKQLDQYMSQPTATA